MSQTKKRRIGCVNDIDTKRCRHNSEYPVEIWDIILKTLVEGATSLVELWKYSRVCSQFQKIIVYHLNQCLTKSMIAQEVEQLKADHPMYCKWLFTIHPHTREEVEEQLLFLKHIRQGHLHVCKWLLDTYDFYRGSSRELFRHSIQDAAFHGHYDTCVWLHERFSLTKEDVQSERNRALFNAGTNGHTGICLWLTRTFLLTEEDLSILLRNDVFDANATSRHFGMLKYLTKLALRLKDYSAVSSLHILKAVIKAGCGTMTVETILNTFFADSSSRKKWKSVTACLPVAAANGYLHLCEWIQKKDEEWRPVAAEEDVWDTSVFSALKAAATAGCSVTLKWLLEKNTALITTLMSVEGPGLVQQCAERGHFEICKLLSKKYELSSEEINNNYDMYIYRQAVRYGCLDFCVWLHEGCNTPSINNPLPLLEAAQIALRENQSLIYVWLVSTFKLSRSDQRTALLSAVLHACSSAELELPRKLWPTLFPDANNPPPHYRITVLMNLVKEGSLESCQWLHQNLRVSTTTLEDVVLKQDELLTYCLERGHLLLYSWLCDTFHITVSEQHLLTFQVPVSLIEDGKLSVLCWMHQKSLLTGDMIRQEDNNLLYTAVEKGNLPICVWLHKTFQLTEEDVRVGTVTALYVAVKNGHLPICVWLHENFHFTVEDIESQHYRIVVKAAERGYQRILCWLKDTFSLESLPINNVWQLAFIRSVQRGHYSLSLWLWNVPVVINVTQQDIGAVFQHSAKKGHLDLCKWLVKTFALTRENVHTHNSYAFFISGASGFLDVASWIDSEFPLTSREVCVSLQTYGTQRQHEHSKRFYAWLHKTKGMPKAGYPKDLHLLM